MLNRAIVGVALLGGSTASAQWVQIHKLTAEDAAERDWFGVSVSIDGGIAIVGAFLLGYVDTFVTTYISGGWGGAVAFVFMIIVIILKPSGLFGKKGRQV